MKGLAIFAFVIVLALCGTARYGLHLSWAWSLSPIWVPVILVLVAAALFIWAINTGGFDPS